MKKVIFVIATLALLAAIALASVFASEGSNNGGGGAARYVCAARAADGGESGKDESIPDSVDDLLGKLDLDGVQSIINMLDSDQLAAFGFSDIVERIRAIADGEAKNEFGNVLSYVLSLLGANVLEFLPMLLSVLAIVIAYNLLNSVKGKYASESIERVVFFSTGAVALTLIVGYFSTVLADAVRFVTSVKTQINAVSPVLITLMTAAGATASAGVTRRL